MGDKRRCKSTFESTNELNERSLIMKKLLVTLASTVLVASVYAQAPAPTAAPVTPAAAPAAAPSPAASAVKADKQKLSADKAQHADAATIKADKAKLKADKMAAHKEHAEPKKTP